MFNVKLLETFHAVLDNEGLMSIEDYRSHFEKYCIVNTREYGPTMWTHTKPSGKFSLGIEAVKEIYHRFHCKAMVTCFPAQHYRLHPKLALKLNILYPEVNESTYNDWGDLESNSNEGEYVIKVGLDDY